MQTCRTDEDGNSSLWEFQCKKNCKPSSCEDPTEYPTGECIRTSMTECLTTQTCSIYVQVNGEKACEQKSTKPVDPPADPGKPVDPPVDPTPDPDFDGVVRYFYSDKDCKETTDKWAILKIDEDNNCEDLSQSPIPHMRNDFVNVMCTGDHILQLTCESDTCISASCNPMMEMTLGSCYPLDEKTCEEEGVCAVVYAQEGKGKFCSGEPLKPDPEPEPPIQPPKPPPPTPMPTPDPVLPDVSDVDNGVVMALYSDSECQKVSSKDVFDSGNGVCADQTQFTAGLFTQTTCFKTEESGISTLLQYNCKGSCEPNACQDPVETTLGKCFRTSDIECMATGVCSKYAMEVGEGCLKEKAPIKPPPEPPSIGPVDPPVDPEPIPDFDGLVVYAFTDAECAEGVTVARRFGADQNCVEDKNAAGNYNSAVCRGTVVTQFSCTPQDLQNPVCDATSCIPELKAEVDMCYSIDDLSEYEGFESLETEKGAKSVLFAQEGKGFCKEDPFVPPPEDPEKPVEPPSPVIPGGDPVDGIIAYIYTDKMCQNPKVGTDPSSPEHILYGPNECKAVEGSNLFKYSACTAGQEFELFDCMADDCSPDSCYASEKHELNICRMLSAESCAVGACSVVYTTHIGDLESICKDDPEGPEYDPDKPVIPAPIPGARGIAAFVYSDNLCKVQNETETVVYDSGSCEGEDSDSFWTYTGCSDDTLKLYDCDSDSCSVGSCSQSEAYGLNTCIEQSLSSCARGVCSIMYVVQGDDKEDEPVCSATPSPVRPEPTPTPSPEPSQPEKKPERKSGAEKKGSAKNPFADAGISLPVGVGAAAGFLVFVALGFFMYSRRRVSARYRSQTAALQLKVAGMNASAASYNPGGNSSSSYPNPIQQQGSPVYV